MKIQIRVLVVLMLAVLACQTPALLPQGNTQEDPANPAIESNTIPTVIPANVETINPASNQEALVALYENVSPGSVAIFTESGQGSGFVFDAQGHIVTNYHVIEGAQSVEVRFTSGYRAYGTIIGTDLDSDLAVIKVDAPAGELVPLRSAILLHSKWVKPWLPLAIPLAWKAP